MYVRDLLGKMQKYYLNPYYRSGNGHVHGHMCDTHRSKWMVWREASLCRLNSNWIESHNKELAVICEGQ